MLRAVLASGAHFVLVGVSLFASAGGFDWPMAWAFLALEAAVKAAAFLVVDPELIRERAAPGRGVKRADAVIATLGFLALSPATLVVAGLDAVRFGWSPPLPLPARGLALLVFALGYAFALWAMRSNPFFATFVRIQTERGHRVVSTGPYAWIRHPGYAGFLIAHAALPVALGSLWSWAPTAAGILCFVARTSLEDRTLARELPGYAEYRRRVRWRLLPGIW